MSFCNRRCCKVSVVSTCLLAAVAISDFPAFANQLTFEEAEEMFRRVTQASATNRVDVFARNGRRLMDLCGVPQGRANGTAHQWTPPNRVVVGSETYSISTNFMWRMRRGDFALYETVDGTNTQIAAFHARVAKTEKENREAFFRDRAYCSMPLERVAKGLRVRRTGADDICIEAGFRHFPKRDDFSYSERWCEAIILHGNITVQVIAPTNAFEIADALLEAGLKKAREEKMEESKRAGKAGK